MSKGEVRARARKAAEGSTSLAKGQPPKESRRTLEGPLGENSSGFAEGSRSLVNGSPATSVDARHPSTILISSSLSPTAYGSPLFRLRAASLAGQTSPARYRPSADRNMYLLREDEAKCSIFQGLF